MTKLKSNPSTWVAEVKKRRVIPVNISFRQFRYYLDVLRESGEEELREAVERDEELPEQLNSMMSPGVRLTKVPRLKVKDAGHNLNEQPLLSPNDETPIMLKPSSNQILSEEITRQRISSGRKESARKSRRMAVVQPPFLQPTLPTPTEGGSTEAKEPSVLPVNAGIDDVTIPKAKPSVASPRDSKTLRPDKRSSANDAVNRPDDTSLQTNARGSVSGHLPAILEDGGIEKNTHRLLRGKRDQVRLPSPKSIWVSDMKARALESYLQLLVNKEDEFLQKQEMRRSKPTLPRLHQSTGNPIPNNNPSPPTYLSMLNLKAQQENSAGRLSRGEPRLPVTWSCRLMQEDMPSVSEEQMAMAKASRTTNRPRNGSNGKPSVSESPRKASLARQGSLTLSDRSANSGGPSGVDGATGAGGRRGSGSAIHWIPQRRGSMTTSGLERRPSLTSTRRGSLLTSEQEILSAFSSQQRRASLSLPDLGGRRIKSASSHYSASTTLSKHSDRNKSGKSPKTAERRRTRLVYRAEPPIPLRIYVNQKESVGERYVEGIVDEHGMPLLPVSRRHIMTGLVYQKSSRSLVPPRPADIKLVRTPPSMQGSSTSLKSL